MAVYLSKMAATMVGQRLGLAVAQPLWPPSWKDKRPQIHLCKSMAMYFLMNYPVFNGKILGKIV